MSKTVKEMNIEELDHEKNSSDEIKNMGIVARVFYKHAIKNVINESINKRIDMTKLYFSFSRIPAIKNKDKDNKISGKK